MLICPICKSELKIIDNSYLCDHRHTYDIAKEGYVHLLPVQKKNSKNPGDNKEMINARREFLEQGYYDPLVEQIINAIEVKENANILDAGCGEGYYSHKLYEHFENTKILGFDISKEAVKKASKKYKDILFFIASVNDIPVEHKSIDNYITTFAPIDQSEIKRILKEDGKAIIISAGPNHMREIAEKIYKNYKSHDYDPQTSLVPSFHLLEENTCSFTLHLKEANQIESMLKMTPYYWSTKQEVLKDILNEKLIVTCEFKIQKFALV